MCWRIFNDIVVTVGSGGSASGIAIANYLTGLKLKCHAVNVCDDAAYFYQKINEDLQIEDIVEISRTTGIMVDPVYNVKAIRGMLHEMNTNPGVTEYFIFILVVCSVCMMEEWTR
ncbi:unnamed protein product [Pocillopora meandrina]|uniref:Uncharacterized protein n=1 Tax=Pocillopora meandrina TaxID=46732 RepID=A0AAU9XSW7_9CNID|nr:unnamed protein product [Pocillopora meandrina]